MLYTEIAKCEPWRRGGFTIHTHTQMLIVTPPALTPLPGLTIVNPGQNVHTVSNVNCESCPPKDSQFIIHAHSEMFTFDHACQTLNSLIV